MTALVLILGVLKAQQQSTGSLFQRVVDARQRRWNFTATQKRGLIQLGVISDGVSHAVVITAIEDVQIITVTFNEARNAPAGQRLHMVMFLNQLNFRITLGGLEKDRSDGEVQVRHGIDVENRDIPRSFIQHLVAQHVRTGCDVWLMVNRAMDGGNLPSVRDIQLHRLLKGNGVTKLKGNDRESIQDLAQSGLNCRNSIWHLMNDCGLDGEVKWNGR
jgi:hypothetical protein